jgi:hypothetical protein
MKHGGQAINKFTILPFKINTMKKIITLLIMLASFAMQAQKTYVKITQDNKTVSYPPGTQFELKNPHGYIVLKYSQTPRVQTIDGDYELILHPDYRTEKEVVKLKKGDKVELVLSHYSEKTDPGNHYGYLDQSAILADKQVTDSPKQKGKKNLTLKLNNGIKFVYEDGNYYAKLRKKYVDVQGKYLIETDLGTLKVSFNPDSGVVWWIFEEGN